MTSAPATDVRQQLPDGTHIDVAFCAGKLVRREHDGIRRHMLDYVVVSVVEEVGCMDGNEFQRGFGNVFGDDLDDTLHSRFHNSLFRPVRSQAIPCFAKKKRKNDKALPME